MAVFVYHDLEHDYVIKHNLSCVLCNLMTHYVIKQEFNRFPGIQDMPVQIPLKRLQFSLATKWGMGHAEGRCRLPGSTKAGNLATAHTCVMFFALINVFF